MKKIICAFIITSMLLVCFSINAITLPDGSELTPKKDFSEYSGWTKITDAEGFKKIVPGGKYYLAANIDLTAAGVNFRPLAGGNNEKAAIVLDGCGFTVKTNEMLIEELPGGNAVGVHSEIRNIVIEGDIVVDATELDSYKNGMALSALVGKANGGIFENIVNNASVTLSSKAIARVAGIIGAVFNDSIVVKNCVNNGSILGEATDSYTSGVGGIVAYVGYSVSYLSASFIDCVNNGNINNISDSSKYSFAGGITAVKADATRIRFINCANNGTVSSAVAFGDYYSRSIYQNIIVANEGISINGAPLDRFVVVASSVDDANAKKIVDFVKSKYNIDISIVKSSDYVSGDAIFVGVGDNYGNVRAGVDCDIDDDGNVKVYLDESAANMSSFIDKFLNERFSTDRKVYDFSFAFDYDKFTYNWPDKINLIGYTHNPSKDKVTNIATGVKYIEKNYTTASGVEVIAQVLILDADADAHFEVFGPEYQTVTDCPYVKECGNLHIAESAKKTTSDLAAEMEDAGKNVLAAINADFFMLSSGCNTPWGMQIIDGKVYREAHTAYKLDTENKTVLNETSHLGKNWMGVTKDGKVVSGGVKDYTNSYKGNIAYGTGGSYFLLQNGLYKKITGSSVGDARTAIGYTADGDIVLVVIDGNDKKNAEYPGANYGDVAQVFMDLDMGITDVLMLDGGGSSNMIVEDTNSHELVLKTHIYSSGGTSTTYGKERKISSIIAIVAD